jgi:hypothetical protein
MDEFHELWMKSNIWLTCMNIVEVLDAIYCDKKG